MSALPGASPMKELGKAMATFRGEAKEIRYQLREGLIGPSVDLTTCLLDMLELSFDLGETVISSLLSQSREPLVAFAERFEEVKARIERDFPRDHQ